MATIAQTRRFSSKISVSPETVWGTAVPPVMAIPMSEIKESPQYERILDQGYRGIPSRDFRTQQAAGHGELSLGGMLYPEEGGVLFNAMLGSELKTGAGPYAHAFANASTPPSYTIQSEIITPTGAANGALQFTGCKLGQLALNWNASAGVLSYTSSWMSQIPTKVTGANPALAPENAPWESWRATITSTGFTSNIMSMDLTFERELQFIHTGQNTQDPSNINQGPLAVSGKLVVAAVDLTTYDIWKAFTQQSFVLSFTYGSGASAKTIAITMTQCNLGDGPFEIDRGAIGVTFGFPFLALHNSTDVGPAAVILTNGKSTVY